MWGQGAMKAKREFIHLALLRGQTGQGKPNIRRLCGRFGVSRTAAYRLLARYAVEGEAALSERSRRPRRSPTRTPDAVVAAVLALRDETHWGAHKIAYVLERDGGGQRPPHRSTVNRILKRNGRITVEASEAATPFTRFEHPEPNDLLQMDFMGPFRTGQGACHSLTVLDDHSRFSLCLAACTNQQSQTVMAHLRAMFERYGLPYRMTMDNGSPWADTGRTELTRLAVWIIRLGVRISHSRPYHPQTQGKDERFHQTVQRELTNHRYFRTLPEVQRAFDRFRDRYNLIRPHESLGMAVPASRYRISDRSMPSELPPIEYPPGDIVRKVTASATIQFRGRLIRVGKACRGLTVGIRPTTTDGLFEVFLCGHKVRDIDLRHPPARKKVSTMS